MFDALQQRLQQWLQALTSQRFGRAKDDTGAAAAKGRSQRPSRSKRLATRDLEVVSQWARQNGYHVKRVRDGDGRIVQYESHGCKVRLELGTSQRAYITGAELRVRMDAQLPPNLQMLLMTKPLAQQLEAQTYQTLVKGQQTDINGSLPEEVRWLSMFKTLQVPHTASRFTLRGASAVHTQHWVDGDLLSRLSRAHDRWLGEDAPLVLMSLRGRIYLRAGVAPLDEAVLDGVRGLVEAAAVMARRVVSKTVDPTAGANTGETTMPGELDEAGAGASSAPGSREAGPLPRRVAPGMFDEPAVMEMSMEAFEAEFASQASPSRPLPFQSQPSSRTALEQR